jgi:hypothetical protein
MIETYMRGWVINTQFITLAMWLDIDQKNSKDGQILNFKTDKNQHLVFRLVISLISRSCLNGTEENSSHEGTDTLWYISSSIL